MSQPSRSRLQRLEEMLVERPEDAFLLYALAMEHKSRSHYQEAATAFQTLLNRHPEFTAAFLHFGTTLVELGRSQQAEQIFRRGIAVCEKKGETHAREELEAALDQI